MADTVGVFEARADEGKAAPKVKAPPAPTQKDFDAFKASINQTVTQLQTENATLRRVSGSPANAVRMASTTPEKAVEAVSPMASNRRLNIDMICS